MFSVRVTQAGSVQLPPSPSWLGCFSLLVLFLCSPFSGQNEQPWRERPHPFCPWPLRTFIWPCWPTPICQNLCLYSYDHNWQALVSWSCDKRVSKVPRWTIFLGFHGATLCHPHKYSLFLHCHLQNTQSNIWQAVALGRLLGIFSAYHFAYKKYCGCASANVYQSLSDIIHLKISVSTPWCLFWANALWLKQWQQRTLRHSLSPSLWV